MGLDLTKISVTINGVDVNLPEEWMGLQIQASFEDSVQANITTEEFSFTGKAREVILEHVEQGYYFEGIPFRIQLDKGDLNYVAFEGMLDVQHSLVELSTDRVTAKIRKLKGLNQFGEQLTGTTFGYLDSLGLITSKDLEYVIEKKRNWVEIIMTSVVIYLMVKELVSLIRRTSANIVEFIALLTGGGTFTSIIGSALLLAGKILLDIAYGVAIISAIIEMIDNLMAYFISIVRTYKVCSYKELMKSACEFLGYNFSSTIPELDTFHYLPSNPYEEEINSGVPRTNDAGYNCGDFFAIMSSMFDAKVGIIGNTVHFENIDSNFWIQQSTFSMPDVFIESERRNGEELAGTRLISYLTDPVDEWTIENIKGTYYEIKTLQSDYRNGTDYLTIRNVDDRLFPFALPNRKDNLNDLEKILKECGQIVDDVIGAFGGSSDYAGAVQGRVGMLRLGTPNHGVPRIIPMNGSKLPANHRELVRAKNLYDKYIKASSFVLSQNGGQKLIREGVRIPFSFGNFLELIENSYFVTETGTVGKVTKLNWTIDGDYAEIDYWVQDPNPSDKLVETYVEPE